MARALETDPINQLEENLQCTVCLEVLTEPRTLHCCHSFCKVCLERIVQTCRDKAPRGRPIREFPCPNCRATFILDPDKHVADMPRNHFICNMVKATAVLDRGTGVPCSHNCRQSYSVARCVTCEKFLCRECLAGHNNYRANNGHSVLTMEELSKPENWKKINDKMYCKEHSGMILKVYCETCDQLICRDCMDFKHVKQGHSCFLIEDVASNYKELLASNNRDMEDALTEGNALLRRLLLTTIELDRDTENIKSKIGQRKEFVAKKVLELLDQKVETLLNKVDEIHKGKQANLHRQTEGTKLFVENIKTSAQLSKRLVDQGTEEEIISSQKMMLDNANHLLIKRQEYFKVPKPVTKLSYTVCTSKAALNEEILRGLANSLGEVNEDREAVVTEMQADSEFDRTILVSGLPERATENAVHIHFQKKRNGGGDIEKVTLLAGGKAMVVFENPKVTRLVFNTKQIFRGNVLEVKRLGMERKVNQEQFRNENVQKSRTVVVSGLPEGTTENRLHIHFQKKRNGGEVEEVKLMPGRKEAIVVFEDMEVAEKVVDTEQIIQGKRVRVELLKTETQATERSVESATILVSGLPEGVTENYVTMHFQKRKNGGGEVKKVQLSSDRKEATVTFDDPKETEQKHEELHQEEEDNWFEDTFLDSKYKLKKEIHQRLASFPWLHGAYGVTGPNRKIRNLHLYVTMKKGTEESTVLADLEDMFRCDVKKYFELFPEPETKPKIKYLGQGLSRSSIKSSSSVSSQLPAPGSCVLACSTTTNVNPLRVPENNQNDDSLDVQGMGTLTMFCSPNGHHYALTCFHVGCANDESRLNAAINKVEDILKVRKLLPNYVEYAKSLQYYFKEGNNSDYLPQYDNEPILYGDDGSTCHALGGFDSYHFDNNCDILSIKINDNTEIDCKVADVTCPNWIKLWKELHKRVFQSNGQSSVEVKKIGCFPAVTHGHIVESQFNYIHGGELLFQDAIVVKGCSGPFLKDGESGSLVFFHDFECEKQVFAYGVCEVDDLVLPVENESTSFIDDGSDADNQDDIEIIFQAEECHECLSNKTGPYYICLRLDTALENLGLENATCLNECSYNSN